MALSLFPDRARIRVLWRRLAILQEEIERAKSTLQKYDDFYHLWYGSANARTEHTLFHLAESQYEIDTIWSVLQEQHELFLANPHSRLFTR